MSLHRELHQLREQPLALRLLKSVALWQAASFFMLIALIWVNEVLDLAHTFYGQPATPIDWFGASILTAGVIVIGFVSVGQTYIKQSRALDLYLVVCAHCRKVRVGESDWTNLEQFLEHRAKAEFSHGICPSCYVEALDDEEAAQHLTRNAPASPEAATHPHAPAATRGVRASALTS